MIVRELVTRLGFSVQDSQLKKYEQGTDNIKKKAEAAAVSFRNIFAAFAGVAAVRSLATIADSMQSLESRIGMLPQTMGDTASAFDEIAKHATDTRQSIEAYGTLYTRIGNAAKNYLTTQEDVLQVTDTISKALVVGGATAQESASVMTQFSQALGAGTLQGEEFRAMAEAAPQYLDALAVALGHPREQLKKLASEGKITTKDVIEATRKIANDFDEKFRQMPMTIGQATTIMGNKWGQFIARFNRESKVVTLVANFIVGAMDSISSGLDTFIETVGGATNALKLLGIVFGAILAVMLPGWAAAAAATIAATWPILAIVAALVLLGLILEDVYNWFVGNESVMGDLIGDSSAWASEIDNLIAVFKFLTTVLSAFWGTAKFIFNAMLMPIKLIGEALKLAFAPIAWAGGKIGEFSKWLDSKGTPVNTPNAVGVGTVAGAAAAASGVAGTNNQTNSLTINQELPPGTAPETAAAAERGTKQALDAFQPWARQMGQAQ
jgi:tape measure domain-containing protein